MEVEFEADILLDEESNDSHHESEEPNDYDNQKLFHFFESYLNKSVNESEGEEEPDLEVNDKFREFVVNRAAKTPQTNRSVRHISCLADIENQKSILRHNTPNR
ncbi:unnamed protein product, partial [Oppiella nova]